MQVNTDLSLSSLYNKSKFLRSVTRPSRQHRGKAVKYETEVKRLAKGKPLLVRHRLKTGDIKATVTTADGQSVKLAYESVGRNKLRINPAQDLEDAKLFVSGTQHPGAGIGNSMVRFLMGIVTGVKNINIGYSEDKGTTLPGFLPEARWLGQENYNGTSAPGFRFLFGGQSSGFGIEAAQKGWLTTDSTQNNPFLMNASRSIYVRATVELSASAHQFDRQLDSFAQQQRAYHL